MNTNFLNFDQTLAAIKTFGPAMTVVVRGENGIGKTALWRALASDPDFAGHIAVPPIDCTQLSDGSIWMPDIDREAGVSRELPNERMGVSRTNQRGVAGSRPALIFFDEVGKARQYVKDMIAPIVYERRVGSYFLPDNSYVFAATNLDAEGLGDMLQAHLRSRVVTLHMRKSTAPELVAYGTRNDWAPEVLAFIDQNPRVCDSFLDYEPGGKYAGKSLERDNPMIFNPRAMQDAFANPRSLERASTIIKLAAQHGIDSLVLDAMLVGTVGHACAAELGAFIRFGNDMVPYARVVRDPIGSPVPDSPMVQLVQVFQFLTRVEDRAAAQAVTQYVLRMRGEMQTLFVRRVAESNKVATFASVTEFIKLMADNRIYYRA